MIDERRCPMTGCGGTMRYAASYRHQSGNERRTGEILVCPKCSSVGDRPDGAQDLTIVTVRCPRCTDRELRPQWDEGSTPNAFILRCPVHGEIALARAKYPSGYTFIEE